MVSPGGFFAAHANAIFAVAVIVLVIVGIALGWFGPLYATDMVRDR